MAGAARTRTGGATSATGATSADRRRVLHSGPPVEAGGARARAVPPECAGGGNREHIVRGKTVVRIAEELVISENTVRMHSKRIYAKLDVHKKQDLIDLVEAAPPACGRCVTGKGAARHASLWPCTRRATASAAPCPSPPSTRPRIARQPARPLPRDAARRGRRTRRMPPRIARQPVARCRAMRRLPAHLPRMDYNRRGKENRPLPRDARRTPARTTKERPMAKTEPSLDQWLAEAKAVIQGRPVRHVPHPQRRGARHAEAAGARRRAGPGRGGAGGVLPTTPPAWTPPWRKRSRGPGVYYVRVWLNEGAPFRGRLIMYVLIGADIRPNCIRRPAETGRQDQERPRGGKGNLRVSTGNPAACGTARCAESHAANHPPVPPAVDRNMHQPHPAVASAAGAAGMAATARQLACLQIRTGGYRVAPFF